MKLSTVITAAAALAGATAIAGAASAAAVYENYYYYGAADGASLYVTNDSAASYADVKIDGVDLGSLAAGSSTSTVYIGDPGETASSTAVITVNGHSTSLYAPDYDFAESGSYIGEAVSAPEPATWALMLVGFGGLGAVLRRRKSAVA